MARAVWAYIGMSVLLGCDTGSAGSTSPATALSTSARSLSASVATTGAPVTAVVPPPFRYTSGERPKVSIRPLGPRLEAEARKRGGGGGGPWHPDDVGELLAAATTLFGAMDSVEAFGADANVEDILLVVRALRAAALHIDETAPVSFKSFVPTLHEWAKFWQGSIPDVRLLPTDGEDLVKLTDSIVAAYKRYDSIRKETIRIAEDGLSNSEEIETLLIHARKFVYAESMDWTEADADRWVGAVGKKYDYRVLDKGADRYRGDRVRFKGKVFNIKETSDLATIQMNVCAGGTDCNLLAFYPGPTKALKGDTIAIYGVVAGQQTYASVTGLSVSVPAVVVVQLWIYR